MRFARGLVVLISVIVWVGEARAADDDLATISEVERLRSYASVCKEDRDGKDVKLADQRAYVLRLERRVAELEVQLKLEQRAKEAREGQP